MNTNHTSGLRLQDLIRGAIEESSTKLKVAEAPPFVKKDDKEKKPSPFAKKEDEKKGSSLFVKKEKGEKRSDGDGDEDKEKKSSVSTDAESIEKVAQALDFVAEKLASDSVFNGGESKQGGEQLPTAGAVAGKQPYKHDKSKSHNEPKQSGTEKPVDSAGSTANATDHAKAPGGPPMPKKGVLKTAHAQDLHAHILELEKNAKSKEDAEYDRLAKGHGRMGAVIGGLSGVGNNAMLTRGHPGAMALGGAVGAGVGYAGSRIGHFVAGKVAPSRGSEKKAEAETAEVSEKTSSAVDLILSKIAESKGGGETLDSKSGSGPKPPSDGKGGNDARRLIESNQAVIDAKKVDAKGPQKRMLSEVLTEPAMSKAHDSKVHENLRNASKGGVKIAASMALLQKIAAEGCSCDGKGTCQYCKLKAAVKAKKSS